MRHIVLPTADVPHFRYTAASRGTPNLPVNLDSMCPHHEKVFAAHYVANHLHNFSLPGINDTTFAAVDTYVTPDHTLHGLMEGLSSNDIVHSKKVQ